MSTTILYPSEKNDKTESLNLQLTKKEINLIIECLLFSSSVNIGADWQQEDFQEMLSLAKKIKKDVNNKIDLSNLLLYKEENYEDVLTEELCEEFGNNIHQEIDLNKA